MGRRSKRELIEPDLTPLIDMVFLLLIFFMVSSVFKKDELALLLSLPKTQEGQTPSKAPTQIIIEVAQDRLACNGQRIDRTELENRLKQAKKDTPVKLRAAQDVQYQRVVAILELLQKYDLTKLSLITEKD